MFHKNLATEVGVKNAANRHVRSKPFTVRHGLINHH
jgi:hypothetical protein